MRNPTKVALKYLAETMVENGSYINKRGTGDFINEAVKLHRKTGSFVTVDTIRRHQKELEQMCQDEMLKRQPLKKDIIVPKQFDDDVEDDYEDDADIALYDEMGYQIDDSMIISIAMAKIERMICQPKVYVVQNQVTPKEDYNMFYLSEDGLTWLKGSFKNQPVGTPGMRYINKAGIAVTERTHAKYMLSQTPNTYTKYDIDVLTKIATGTYD
jgi:hypothetical protein